VNTKDAQNRLKMKERTWTGPGGSSLAVSWVVGTIEIMKARYHVKTMMINLRNGL